MNIILSFNRKSNTGEPVSVYEDKIVLISRESEITDPELEVPYVCEVEIYDTNPSNPVKGSRIVKVLEPFEAEENGISIDDRGIIINLKTTMGETECVIAPGAFDPRVEVQRAMRRLGCKVDYAKIDTILARAKEKLG